MIQITFHSKASWKSQIHFQNRLRNRLQTQPEQLVPFIFLFSFFFSCLLPDPQSNATSSSLRFLHEGEECSELTSWSSCQSSDGGGTNISLHWNAAIGFFGAPRQVFFVSVSPVWASRWDFFLVWCLAWGQAGWGKINVSSALNFDVRGLCFHLFSSVFICQTAWPRPGVRAGSGRSLKMLIYRWRHAPVESDRKTCVTYSMKPYSSMTPLSALAQVLLTIWDQGPPPPQSLHSTRPCLCLYVRPRKSREIIKASYSYFQEVVLHVVVCFIVDSWNIDVWQLNTKHTLPGGHFEMCPATNHKTHTVK